MGAKEKILEKIHSLMTNKFETPKEVFEFYDKNKDGVLDKSEIKSLLKDAGVGGFIRGLVAGEMIKGYNKSGGKTINWTEFKVAVSELERDY